MAESLNGSGDLSIYSDNLTGRDSALKAEDTGRLTNKPSVSPGNEPGDFSIVSPLSLIHI